MNRIFTNSVLVPCLAVCALSPTAMAQPSNRTCSPLGDPQICVRFDNHASAPVEDTHFKFTSDESGVLGVEFLLGDDGQGTTYRWRVWCWSNQTSQIQRPISAITGYGAENYRFTLRQPDGGTGTNSLGTIDVNPQGDGDYYSTMQDTLSVVNGITGGIYLEQKESDGTGGVLWMSVFGDIAGTINVPATGAQFDVFGTSSATITIGTVQGDFDIGPLALPDCGTFTAVSGPITIGSIDTAGIYIRGDLEADITVTDEIVGTSVAFIWGEIGDVDVEFAAVEAGTTFRLEFGTVNKTCDVGGDLKLVGGINSDSLLKVFGALVAGGSIDLNNQAVAGPLTLHDGGAGTIINGGAVSDTVTLSKDSTKPFSGTATFASVSSGGTIITTNGALSGTVTVSGAMAGAIDLDGDLSGDLSLGGLVTGTITVADDVSGDIELNASGTSTGSIDIGGALAAYGRILVDEKWDGAITIEEETASLSLIHLEGGFLSNGLITVNNSEGDFDASGDILVGLVSPGLPMPSITYDGCIQILDASADGDFGELLGEIDVNGCHATDDDLGVTIEGPPPELGAVTINQTGCANQVNWSDCP